MKKIRTHYQNLQVTENASIEVIRGAYKYLAQKWHPDKNPSDRAKAEQVTKILNAAYEILSDPELRKNYDQKIALQRSKGSDGQQEQTRRDTEEGQKEKARKEAEWKRQEQARKKAEAKRQEQARKEPEEGVASRESNQNIALGACILLFVFLLVIFNSSTGKPEGAETLSHGPPVGKTELKNGPAVTAVEKAPNSGLGKAASSGTGQSAKRSNSSKCPQGWAVDINNPSSCVFAGGAPKGAMVTTPCEFKSVMTDQDFVNCGRTPPR